MFNTEAYAAAVEEMRQTILAELADLQAGWRADVNLRYGLFLAGQARRNLDRVLEPTLHQSQAREWMTGQLMQIVSTTHAAAALIRGSVVVPDEVGVEAVMRLHEIGNRAPSA